MCVRKRFYETNARDAVYSGLSLEVPNVLGQGHRGGVLAARKSTLPGFFLSEKISLSKDFFHVKRKKKKISLSGIKIPGKYIDA